MNLFCRQGSNQVDAKGAEAPPLSKSNVKNDKILESFDLFVSVI